MLLSELLTLTLASRQVAEKALRLSATEIEHHWKTSSLRSLAPSSGRCPPEKNSNRGAIHPAGHSAVQRSWKDRHKIDVSATAGVSAGRGFPQMYPQTFEKVGVDSEASVRITVDTSAPSLDSTLADGNGTIVKEAFPSEEVSGQETVVESGDVNGGESAGEQPAYEVCGPKFFFFAVITTEPLSFVFDCAGKAVKMTAAKVPATRISRLWHYGSEYHPFDLPSA